MLYLFIYFSNIKLQYKIYETHSLQIRYKSIVSIIPTWVYEQQNRNRVSNEEEK